MGEILKAIGIRGQLVAVQLAGFLITLVILKILLFERVSRFVAARKKDEEGLGHEVAAARKELEAAEARLRARQAETEKQAYELIQAEVRAGLKRKADLVEAAHAKAQAELARVRASVVEERAKALSHLEKDVVDLGLLMAAGATKKKLDQAKYAAVAERAVRRET